MARNKVLLFITMSLVIFGAVKYKTYLYKQTDGFSQSNIQFDLPYQKKWEIPELSKEKKGEIAQILNQQFTYLGKGARSYAFCSEDGKVVLKFFKYRYHEPHWTVRYLPAIQPFEYFRQKKVNKVSLDTVLSGYHNAYLFAPEMTGLIALQLNLDGSDYPPVTVIGKRGRKHPIDLSQTRFVLQKKTTVLSDLLKQLFTEGNYSLAKERIRQVIDLYSTLYSKGLNDLGRGFVQNNGFIGETPIHFDVGKLIIDPHVQNPEIQESLMDEKLQVLYHWTQKNFPQALPGITED